MSLRWLAVIYRGGKNGTRGVVYLQRETFSVVDDLHESEHLRAVRVWVLPEFTWCAVVTHGGLRMAWIWKKLDAIWNIVLATGDQAMIVLKHLT